MEQSIDKKRLEELVAQVPAGATDEILYAGLAVLARDMYQYLEKNNLLDKAVLFKEAVDAVRDDEKKRPNLEGKEFPEYRVLNTSTLPTGLTEKAASGQPDLTPLFSPGIIHEWTYWPGKKLYDRLFSGSFAPNLKQNICGPNGLYEQLNKEGFNNQVSAALAGVIVAAIATGPAIPISYALAVYGGLLLTRAGLGTYCKPQDQHP